MKPATFKRSGLHRLECAAGHYTYGTVAQLEAAGLPVCGCGERFLPDRLELALLLGVDDAPCVAEYIAECELVSIGQKKKMGAGHNLRMLGKSINDPSVTAAARVESRRRERARSNRLGALLPAAEPLPF